jgi:hypothetical protein
MSTDNIYFECTNQSRQRSPGLRIWDRIVWYSFCAGFLLLAQALVPMEFIHYATLEHHNYHENQAHDAEHAASNSIVFQHSLSSLGSGSPGPSPHTNSENSILTSLSNLEPKPAVPVPMPDPDAIEIAIGDEKAAVPTPVPTLPPHPASSGPSTFAFTANVFFHKGLALMIDRLLKFDHHHNPQAHTDNNNENDLPEDLGAGRRAQSFHLHYDGDPGSEFADGYDYDYDQLVLDNEGMVFALKIHSNREPRSPSHGRADDDGDETLPERPCEASGGQRCW